MQGSKWSLVPVWWRPGEPLSEAGDRDTLTSYIQIGKDRWSRLQQLYLDTCFISWLFSLECFISVLQQGNIVCEEGDHVWNCGQVVKHMTLLSAVRTRPPLHKFYLEHNMPHKLDSESWMLSMGSSSDNDLKHQMHFSHLHAAQTIWPNVLLPQLCDIVQFRYIESLILSYFVLFCSWCQPQM